MVVFDGNNFAKEIEEVLKNRIQALGRAPKLAIVLSGGDLSSAKYVEMKKKKGIELGVEVSVLEKLADVSQVDFDGVMVQLPSDEDLSLIDPYKDVDGLNPNSEFVPATVKAVEKILDQAYRETEKDIDENLKIAVVGSKGNVGRALVERMKRFGIEPGEFDLGDDLNQLIDYSVIISAVGKESLIRDEMVMKGAVCIDVGFPKGDFDHEIKNKALFWTPVPGGVGPVTVICLFENLVMAAEE